MATHSSTLAWKIPWMEEPVGLQSMGLQRVGHDLATSLHFHYKLGTVLGTEDRAENTADKSLALTELEASECLLNVELLTQSPAHSSPSPVLHHPSVMGLFQARILEQVG